MPASGRRRSSRHLAPRHERCSLVVFSGSTRNCRLRGLLVITLGERQLPSYRSFYGSGSSLSSSARDA